MDRDQNCSFDLIYFQRSGVYTYWFFHMCLILLLAQYVRNQRIFTGKSVELLSWLAICLLFWWFISHLLGDYANINMWKSDHMKAWNCSRDDCPPSAPLSAPQTHTHTNKKDTVCLMTSAHPTSSPTQPFSNSHHDVRTSFLITQLLENKRKFYPISLESSHEQNSTVPIFNKSKKSIQT